jgi:hypothetical protein
MAKSAPTIPIASAAGKPDDFEITEQNWQKIERAYQNSLSADVRKRIFEATMSFVYWEVFERAKPRRVAIERIEAIKKATGNLSQILAVLASDASVHVNHLVKKHFRDPRLTMQRGDLFHALDGVLTSLSAACDLALKEILNLPGYHEGECWDQWIRKLTRIVREHELPFHASKGSDKTSEPAHSPFVLMVEALQDCVPASARRHHFSRDALATAIHRARTNTARKVGRRDKKAVRSAQ